MVAAVAAGRAELDAFEDVPLEAGPRLDVFTTRALWGPVCGAWLSLASGTRWIGAQFAAPWRARRLPAYAQFDNAPRL